MPLLLRKFAGMMFSTSVSSAIDQAPLDRAPASPYCPSPKEIVLLKAMIMRDKKLPLDVVEEILDHAEYWASSCSEVDFKKQGDHPFSISNADRFLLRSYPVGFSDFSDLKHTLSDEQISAWQFTDVKPIRPKTERTASFFHGLTDQPTPKRLRPVRKIVFTFISRDQGWGGDPGCRGTYKGSWSWFEVGLERFDEPKGACSNCGLVCNRPGGTHYPLCSLRPIKPTVTAKKNGKLELFHPLGHDCQDYIQRNVTASGEEKEHRVEWRNTDDVKRGSEEELLLVDEGRGIETLDGSFVRQLQLGDVVTVWGKARFPGWSNRVSKVTLEVFWAI